MITAHLSGGREYPLNGRSSATSALQGTLGQSCWTVYARRSTVGELARRGFSPEGIDSVQNFMHMSNLLLGGTVEGVAPGENFPGNCR
jgi:hypothetical protein